MDIKKYCVTRDYTIMEAMQVLERNKARGAIVLGEEGKACGFISMGDIIYALVEGKNMYSRIGQIYNPSFLYLQEKDYKKALDIFKKRSVYLIPVVDEEMRPTDVITLWELFRKMELKEEP